MYPRRLHSDTILSIKSWSAMGSEVAGCERVDAYPVSSLNDHGGRKVGMPGGWNQCGEGVPRGTPYRPRAASREPVQGQWVSGFAGARPNPAGHGVRKPQGESMVRFTD